MCEFCGDGPVCGRCSHSSAEPAPPNSGAFVWATGPDRSEPFPALDLALAAPVAEGELPSARLE